MNGKKFVIPDRKYWLADTGYSNSNYLLTSFNGIRYHLKKQYLAQQRL